MRRAFPAGLVLLIACGMCACGATRSGLEPVSFPLGNYTYVARDDEGTIEAFGHLVIEGQEGETLSGSLWVKPAVDRIGEVPPDDWIRNRVHLPAVGPFQGKIKHRRVFIGYGLLWPLQILVLNGSLQGQAFSGKWTAHGDGPNMRPESFSGPFLAVKTDAPLPLDRSEEIDMYKGFVRKKR